MATTLIDPASFPSVQDIESTFALKGEPILRNLKITQGYWALSTAMSAMVGRAHVSWCGFASWSSKTIGVSIREANMRQRGLLAITQSRLYQDTIQRIVNLLEAAGVVGIGPFDNVIAQALEDGIDSLKQGNADVYGEIGTLYSKLISALGNDVDFDLTRLAPVVAYLDGKPSEQGGQELLRQAAENYYRARFETSPGLKAQLVLLANARVGKHEQMRLQGCLEEFLGGALEQRIVEHAQQQCRGIAPLEIAVTPIARAAGKLAKEEWTKLLTDFALHLDFPGNETLHLRSDVPPPRGQPLYPAELRDLSNPDALAILGEFGADLPSALGTGATDWTSLVQRMRYILVLFRSRQLESILLSEAFSPPQQSDLAAGRMPTAPPPL
ncbi:MAG: hypothetical protein JO121_16215 [Deltaproteobacteria bacterium]|nr:hypothetical protein [Deltaproteobacteria bacterium]